ncbi:MAG: cytidylate kinase family protein [bacterium]|nr:cytidylate kinase family protein [bacterium]
MRITISGTPGSGKSTVAKLLAKKLGYRYLNTGQIFREAAAKRGMTLEAFAEHVNTHPELDRKFDAQLVARARTHPNLILEGRLAGWMTKRAKLPALRVWITAQEAVRVDRLMQRDGETRAETLRKLRERAAGERNRYRRTYGVDLADRSPYDMVIATDDMNSRQLAAVILKEVRAWESRRRSA